MSKKYTLTNSDENTELARVDDIVLTKGGDAQELSDEQAKRLKDAGMKLKAEGDDDDKSKAESPGDQQQGQAKRPGANVN